MPTKADFAELFFRSLEDALLRHLPFGPFHGDAVARTLERDVEAATAADGAADPVRGAQAETVIGNGRGRKA